MGTGILKKEVSSSIDIVYITMLEEPRMLILWNGCHTHRTVFKSAYDSLFALLGGKASAPLHPPRVPQTLYMHRL